MRRLIIAVALLALIVGSAALGFAAAGHAANETRNFDLHWGDHLSGDTINVSCAYALGAHQQHPHLTCFGPGTKGYDPELVVSWTRGAVTVTRCWNDCASPKTKLLLRAKR